METNKKQKSKLILICVIIGDLLVMNLLFAVLYEVWTDSHVVTIYNRKYWELISFNSLCYIIIVFSSEVFGFQRYERKINIVEHVVMNCLKFAMISIAFIFLMDYNGVTLRFMILYHLLNFILLMMWRIGCNCFIKYVRSCGRNSLSCVYVGCGQNMRELYVEMMESASGYSVCGYFANGQHEQFDGEIFYLGRPNEAVAWLEKNKVHQVYCSMPSKENKTIELLIHWCEKNFVQFFSVPNMCNYEKRRMWLYMIGDVPILSIHREPLSDIDNRFVKRSFDLLISGLFLCTIFPFIYLIVGIIIKTTSPGPIFFKQKRTGINGKEFLCYKFRSMKVNKDADIIQTTKNDPRKTKFGNFIRKMNIDELPQLINVFWGDMSLVGPRPHMLKHTDEYSALIDNYLVRHRVKPGITGWAQVTGYRGETELLSQMVGRVQADIWYMEHWSFLLDLHIVYLTIVNMLEGEEKAY